MTEIIVLVYEGRGTQTEVDCILLRNEDFISKTILVIKKESISHIEDSVSRVNWKTEIFPKVKQTIQYENLPLLKSQLDAICEPLEYMRQKKYADMILHGVKNEK